MLTERDFKIIEKEARNLYRTLEFEIIEEIAERIANVGYANTVVLNNIQIAQEAGILYQDVVRLVAKHNHVAESEIEDIFKKAGAKTIKSDDKIYKQAGLNPKGLSTSMLQQLEATARKTHNNLSNLCMTTANTSQVQFYNAINKAYLETSTGVKSYSQSIIDAIKEMSNQGPYIEYPSGQHRSIESAVRMNVLTSVNQTSGQLQLMRAEEMNWDLMEISAHSGARPDHQEWQGKVVSRSGQKGYLSLDDIGYGTATGFQGVNCRHTWFPYYEGSTLTYTNKELENLKNETVMYNGEKISKYDANQIQRRMERKIRDDKKYIAGLQGMLTSASHEIEIETVQNQFRITSNQLKQKELTLNDFIIQTQLKRDRMRENISSNNKSLSQKIVQASKNIDKNKEILYNSSIPLGKKLVFFDNSGTKTFIPKDAEITNILEIAGENSKEFRNANKYVEKYGGKETDYSKRAGKIESDKYTFDIHWVQGKNGLMTEWKIANKTLKGGI